MFLVLGHYIIHLQLLMVSAVGRPSMPMMDPYIIQLGPIVFRLVVRTKDQYSYGGPLYYSPLTIGAVGWQVILMDPNIIHSGLIVIDPVVRTREQCALQ